MAHRNMKPPVEYWDDWIVHHVTQKLDLKHAKPGKI